MGKYLEYQWKKNDLHKKEAIILDKIVYNYPIKARGGGTIYGEAVFNIKTSRIDNSGNIYPQN